MDHVRITEEQLSIEEARKLVTCPSAGAISMFIGQWWCPINFFRFLLISFLEHLNVNIHYDGRNNERWLWWKVCGDTRVRSIHSYGGKWNEEDLSAGARKVEHSTHLHFASYRVTMNSSRSIYMIQMWQNFDNLNINCLLETFKFCLILEFLHNFLQKSLPGWFQWWNLASSLQFLPSTGRNPSTLFTIPSMHSKLQFRYGKRSTAKLLVIIDNWL